MRRLLLFAYLLVCFNAAAQQRANCNLTIRLDSSFSMELLDSISLASNGTWLWNIIPPLYLTFWRLN